MSTYRTGPVVAITAERPGLQRLLVRVDGEDQRAYNLTSLTGEVEVGDDVVCNTTAVGLGLGTGGWHVVHWNLSRRTLDLPGGGHIMKVRYTSLQVDTGAAEEHDPDEAMPALGGVPVIVCSLHSQVGVAAAAFARCAPRRRLAYVMTDGAALPLALSDLVHELRARELLVGTVTAGHAFGGDLEAVNTVSAIAVAVRSLGADAVVVGMGPGVVGTASALGTTSIEVAAIVDCVRQLGAQPIVALRASSGDPRPRHQGISHHARTALQLCHGALLAVPVGDEATDGLDALRADHERVRVEVPEVAALLDEVGIRITTMGRGPAQDPLFFRFAAAAGVLGARRLAAP